MTPTSTPSIPVAGNAIIDGVELENANGELCGGTFEEQLRALLQLGFRPARREGRPGAAGRGGGAVRLQRGARAARASAPARCPSQGEIVSPLEVGSTAIGQFKVLATTLGMASVSQTVANRRGQRSATPWSRAHVGARCASRLPRWRRHIGKLMVGRGRSTAPAPPPRSRASSMAGKTGTAELEDTRGAAVDEQPVSDPSNTDAWFTAYAPAGKPDHRGGRAAGPQRLRRRDGRTGRAPRPRQGSQR